jgi:glutathione S-transferase
MITLDGFGRVLRPAIGETAENRRTEMVQEAGRWLDGPERRLGGREWIARADFTVADILLATAVREIRKTDPIDRYPRLKAYPARALRCPAWQRTLNAYS